MNSAPTTANAGSVQQALRLDSAAILAAIRRWPALRGLRASGAGYVARTCEYLPLGTPGGAALLYCVRGNGRCELRERIRPVRPGDLTVLARGQAAVCRPHPSSPWSVHWAEFEGDRAGDYVRALQATADCPVLHHGDDAQVAALFQDVRRDLQWPAPANVFHAAHALGHLLSVLIQHASRRIETAPPGVSKVAAAITYMTEHVEEPLRIGRLAEFAGLSPSHFTVLFRQQTGCSPRAYLHLLRMHQAVGWLTTTALTVKEIAGRLGYGDPFHFSRQFKAFSGLAPRDYRARPGPA